MGPTSAGVRVTVKLCLQKLFDLIGARIKLEPLFVCRLGNTIRGNACGLQPRADAVYAVLRGGE